MSESKCRHGNINGQFTCCPVCVAFEVGERERRAEWRKAYLAVFPAAFAACVLNEENMPRTLTRAGEIAADAAENFIEADKKRWEPA